MVLKKTAGKEQNVLVMNIKLHGKVISHTLDLYKGDLERSSKEVVKCTIEDFVTKHSLSSSSSWLRYSYFTHVIKG